MEITYINKKVEKYFLDYQKMQKKLSPDWVRAIKNHMEHLEMVACFGFFLDLRVGRPEQLKSQKGIRYSLHVSSNVRLVLKLNATQDTIRVCSKVEVEGVCDYHGEKTNWYIP